MPRQMITRHRSKSVKTKKIIQQRDGILPVAKSDVCQYFLQIVKGETMWVRTGSLIHNRVIRVLSNIQE